MSVNIELVIPRGSSRVRARVTLPPAAPQTVNHNHTYINQTYITAPALAPAPALAAIPAAPNYDQDPNSLNVRVVTPLEAGGVFWLALSRFTRAGRVKELVCLPPNQWIVCVNDSNVPIPNQTTLTEAGVVNMDSLMLFYAPC